LKLILIGIQGSGKSTQGNLLSQQLGISYLSSGHIFRDMAREKTPLGRYIKETMNAGFLIPDDKTLEIVEEYLKKSEYKNGYILDGFPRTVAQAKKFANGITAVFYIKVSDKEALWRLAGRDEEGVREDNTLKALMKRISEFHIKTKPVIEFYREKGNLYEIDGEKDVNVINREILQKLEKH